MQADKDSETWKSRVGKKLATTAALSGALGGVTALQYRQPMLFYVGGTVASCCIIVGTFAAFQEFGRAATEHCIANSAVAGGLTGSLAYAVHYGPKTVATGLVAGSLLGGGLHWLGAAVKPAQTSRAVLADLGFLGTEERPVSPERQLEGDFEVAAEGEKAAPRRRWFPVQHVHRPSREEWQALIERRRKERAAEEEAIEEAKRQREMVS